MKKKKKEPMRIDAAVDYDMDAAEVRAYRLTLLWLEWSRKLFPDYKHQKMNKNDPRKGSIFQYCYKCQRELVLKETEYPLYVRAQLEVLKALSKNNPHIMITPACLSGPKAWVRWQLWKKKYDQASKTVEERVHIPTNQIKMTDALLKTKDFLAKTFGSLNYKQQLLECFGNGKLKTWVALNKVSPYYLLLTPILKNVDVASLTTMDLEVFQQVISPELKTFFEKNFAHEYQ